MRPRSAKIRSTVHKIPWVRFEAEQRLTSYAGLVVFQHLFLRPDLRNGLRRCFDHLALEAHAIFETATVVTVLVEHLLLGLDSRYGLLCRKQGCLGGHRKTGQQGLRAYPSRG